jgi:hypothetical protein
MKNNTFVLYADILGQLDGLSREQMGDLFKGILLHVNGEEPADMDGVTRMAYGFITSQIDRDKGKYLEKCEKNRENVKKRYDRIRPYTNAYEGNASYTNAYEEKVRIPTDTDSDSDTDTDADSDTDVNNTVVVPKRTTFVPPSIADVQNYADEKGLKIDPEQFVDFYASKGWLVGKSKMKDWRAAVRNWCKRDRASPTKNKFTNFDARTDNADKYAQLEQAQAKPVEDWSALERALLGGQQ